MTDTAWDMIFWYIVISFIFAFIGRSTTGIERQISDLGTVVLFGFFFLIKAIEKGKSKV